MATNPHDVAATASYDRWRAMQAQLRRMELSGLANEFAVYIAEELDLMIVEAEQAVASAAAKPIITRPQVRTGAPVRPKAFSQVAS